MAQTTDELLTIYRHALEAIATADNEPAERIRILARLILENNPCPTV